MMDWIKCTDRMPPERELVIGTTKYLVWQEKKYVKQVLPGVYYFNGKWYFGPIPFGYEEEYQKEVFGEITHWMPMPKPAED